MSKRFTDFIDILRGSFRSRIQAATLTADRTLTAPDKTGTIALLQDIPGAGSTTPPSNPAAGDLWTQIDSNGGWVADWVYLTGSTLVGQNNTTPITYDGWYSRDTQILGPIGDDWLYQQSGGVGRNMATPVAAQYGNLCRLSLKIHYTTSNSGQWQIYLNRRSASSTSDNWVLLGSNPPAGDSSYMFFASADLAKIRIEMNGSNLPTLNGQIWVEARKSYQFIA
jgi:hypothetical protein